MTDVIVQALNKLKVNWEVGLILLWKTLRFVSAETYGGEQRIYHCKIGLTPPKEHCSLLRSERKPQFKDFKTLRMNETKDVLKTFTGYWFWVSWSIYINNVIYWFWVCTMN
jgi:hypothetical protein